MPMLLLLVMLVHRNLREGVSSWSTEVGYTLLIDKYARHGVFAHTIQTWYSWHDFNDTTTTVTMMTSKNDIFLTIMFLFFWLFLLDRQIGKDSWSRRSLRKPLSKGVSASVAVDPPPRRSARWHVRMIPNLATYTALMKAYAKVGISFQLHCVTRNSWGIDSMLKHVGVFCLHFTPLSYPPSFSSRCEAQQLKQAEAVLDRLKTEGFTAAKRNTDCDTIHGNSTVTLTWQWADIIVSWNYLLRADIFLWVFKHP